MSKITREPGIKPTQRRWRDLAKLRLFISLAGASIPCSLLFALMLVFTAHNPSVGRAGGGAGVITAVLWSLLVGALYFAVVTRKRGILGRAECLLLGAIVAVTLPIVMVPVAVVIHHIRDDGMAAVVLSNWPERVLTAMVFFGLPAIPLGLVGGWIIWRFGVRPAIADLAPVFD